MTKIVKVEPVPKYFAITWMLGAFCNYSCMYCPPHLHDSTSKPHSLEDLQTVWRNIYSKTAQQDLDYKISFTGGEVTANKSFLPLLEWLKEDYSRVQFISVTTNGSASTAYYKRLISLVESLTFSVHSEFIEERKFFNTVAEVAVEARRHNRSVHVNIMDEHWNQYRIVLYRQFLDMHKINYTVNPIDYSRQWSPVFVRKGIYDL